MRRLFCYCCLLLAFLIIGCTGSKKYQVLESRLATIERENNRQAAIQKREAQAFDQLKLGLDAGAKTNREKYAELKYEIQQMNEKFFRIQGQMEELQHNMGSSDRTRQEGLEKRLDRLDNAISKNFEKTIALERYMGFEPSTTGSVSVGPETDKPVTEQGTTQEGLYGFAKRLFDQGDKENARTQFENFINKYPGSKKADNARFWIADSYYAEKWFEKAILEYQKVLETYPDSNKAAAARLKQGYAFAALGETANARLILKELIKRHPDSKEAQYAGARLKKLK